MPDEPQLEVNSWYRDKIISEMANLAYSMYARRLSLHLPHTFTEDAIQTFLLCLLERARRESSFALNLPAGGRFTLASWETMTQAARMKFLRAAVGRKAVDLWRKDTHKGRMPMVGSAPPDDDPSADEMPSAA